MKNIFTRRPEEGRVVGNKSQEFMKASNELSRRVNRTKARLLTNLEDANCPQIYRNAVVAELDLLRADLTKIESIGEYNGTDTEKESFGNR